MRRLGAHWDESGINRQPAAIRRHRVPGVHAQIRHDLLNHAGIGLDPQGMGVALEFQVDGLTQQPPEHLEQIGQHFVQIDLFYLDNLPPAEHQQLSGQAGGPFGIAHQLPERMPHFLGQVRIAQQQAELHQCRG